MTIPEIQHLPYEWAKIWKIGQPWKLWRHVLGTLTCRRHWVWVWRGRGCWRWGDWMGQWWRRKRRSLWRTCDWTVWCTGSRPSGLCYCCNYQINNVRITSFMAIIIKSTIEGLCYWWNIKSSITGLCYICDYQIINKRFMLLLRLSNQRVKVYIYCCDDQINNRRFMILMKLSNHQWQFYVTDANINSSITGLCYWCKYHVYN